MGMNYVEMFVEYELGILKSMCQNLIADLEAGYDYFSTDCVRQRKILDARRSHFETEYRRVQAMPDREAQRWCKEYLKRRGAL